MAQPTTVLELLQLLAKRSSRNPTFREIVLDLWYPKRRPDFGPDQAAPYVLEELNLLTEKGIVEEQHEDGETVYVLIGA